MNCSSRDITYIVDADLKSYFDTIPHDRLMALVGQKVSDGRLLTLIDDVPQARRPGRPARVDARGWAVPARRAVISPLLSNIYLNPLDHQMAQAGFEMVRYADDFVILCRSPEEASRALALVQDWTAEAGLTLHPTKTRDRRREGQPPLSFWAIGSRRANATREPRV